MHVFPQMTEQPKPRFRGILVSKGSTLTIKNFRITLGADGTADGSPDIHLSLNMCPYWFEIAFQQLQQSKSAHNALLAAHARDNEQELGQHLHAEALAGMQAVVASCIAVDAFHTSLRECMDLPPDLVTKWRKKRPKRHALIATIFNRAFKISDKSNTQLHEVLKQNFGFRDRAVHPRGVTSAPVLYPEVERAVEWRLAEFRFANAVQIAGLNLSVTAQCIGKPVRKEAERAKDLCGATATQLQPLIEQWEENFTKIVPTEDTGG